MEPSAYTRWAESFNALYPNIAYYFHVLPFTPIHIRKAHLTYTRVQIWPSEGTRIRKNLCDVFEQGYLVPPGLETLKPTFYTNSYNMLEYIQDYAYSPLIHGLISTAIRMAPYADYKSVQDVKEQTIHKELQAAMGVYHPVSFNYTPLFSPDFRDRIQVFSPRNPIPTPHVMHNLHQCFEIAKGKLTNKILYPKISRKTVGATASKMMDVLSDNIGYRREEEDGSIIEGPWSLMEVERFYHETGIRGKGPVEMRSSWKYNDLKPRAYYAIGPDDHVPTMFEQEIFNIILDCFPMVHRHDRFETPYPIDQSLSGFRLITYDYSSFTSTLHEIRSFIFNLAEYFKDTPCVIIDTHLGPQRSTIGSLLHTYNSICNENARMDVTRILDLKEIYEPLILQHNCGMLGVPGNISSCTLLHGVHLAVITNALDRAKCIGDDALVKLLMEVLADYEDFMYNVTSLGDMAIEKGEFWDEIDDESFESESWHYTKRPITRVSSNVVRGMLFIWPSIEVILHLVDKYHTSTFTGKTPEKLKITVFKQWIRLLDQIKLLYPKLSDDERNILYIFQKSLYRRTDTDKLGGPYKPKGFPFAFFIPPFHRPDDFGTDWRIIAIRVWELEELCGVGPVYRVADEFAIGLQGEEFTSGSTKLYGLMEKLGYLEKKIKMAPYLLYTGRDRDEILMRLSGDIPMTYEYVVKKDFPSWTQSLLRHPTKLIL